MEITKVFSSKPKAKKILIYINWTIYNKKISQNQLLPKKKHFSLQATFITKALVEYFLQTALLFKHLITFS